MRKYVLLGCATGIGGWQLYIDARLKYMEEQGATVYVVHANEEMANRNVVLPNLRNGNTLSLDEIVFAPHVLTKRQVQKVMNKILNFISYDKNDEYFVESTSMPFSYWGELLAERLSCINYAYLLHSHIENTPHDIQRFFEFKYNNHMLAGQSKITLPDLFEGYMNIDPEDTRAVSASWANPISSDDCGLEHELQIIDQYRKEDRCIVGYFGTLSKPHFIKLCDFIINYANSRTDKKFAFISVGSSANGVAEMKQMEVEKQTSNCVTINIKEVYPVPRRVFEIMDLCIGSWGSATVAARVCQRTIRLTNDVEIIPQGIIGITLTEYPYYLMGACDENLDELIDGILFNGSYDCSTYVSPPNPKDFREAQKYENSIFRPFDPDVENPGYYDVRSFKCHNLKEKVGKVVSRTIGVKTLGAIRVFAKKIFNVVSQGE